jgi:hypothetical protein
MYLCTNNILTLGFWQTIVGLAPVVKKSSNKVNSPTIYFYIEVIFLFGQFGANFPPRAIFITYVEKLTSVLFFYSSSLTQSHKKWRNNFSMLKIDWIK